MLGNSLVILIDYWDSENPNEKNIRDILFQNIVDTVPTIPNLKLVVHSSYDQEKYHPNQFIHNYTWPCQKTNLFYASELKDYINSEKVDIQNFFVMGMHWDRCIKNRDLGWKSLKTNFPNKKIFTVENCILSLDNHRKISYWPDLKKDCRCKLVYRNFYEIIE